jgi:uncharacterized protein YprB with RNaseH-like and TPR domain
MSTLSDRIRGIVKQPASVVGADQCVGSSAAGGHAGPLLHSSPLDKILGGTWQNGSSAPCFVVERRFAPSAKHGVDRIGDLADWLAAGGSDAPLLAGGSPARAPFVFFDLETTGLNGGAGTHVFLIGIARFDDDRAFVTKQFLMTRLADERPLLDCVAAELLDAGALVSFNGKSFDAPMLETRYLFHRLEWPGDGVPHVDALHPARRFWPGDCSLVALERQTLGARRVGDVPQTQIPARYFHFLRTGDARPLAAVLEHNRIDLLTLGALAARLLRLVQVGVEAARDAREVFALGTTYARAGQDARARECFERAVARSPAPAGAFDPVRLDSLRALALACRRARRFDEAARCWGQIVDARGCPPALRREAAEALAIHHEHRVHDLDAAKDFALLSLTDEARPSWTEAVQHRLARLERKMNIGRLL